MCDQSTAKGIVTYKDIQNSLYYARMKIIYEQLNDPKKNKDLSWVWTNSDKSPSYSCPSGLTCYDGYVRINNKEKCSELGAKGFNQYSLAENPYEVIPNAKNGFFLEWKGDEKTGECYMGNPYFKKQCLTNNFDNHPPDDKRRGKGLYWDDNQGRCLITKDYCDSIGYNKDAYKPGPEANGNGGTCELTGWGDVGQFIFGQTITRGVFNSGCR